MFNAVRAWTLCTRGKDGEDFQTQSGDREHGWTKWHPSWEGRGPTMPSSQGLPNLDSETTVHGSMPQGSNHSWLLLSSPLTPTMSCPRPLAGGLVCWSPAWQAELEDWTLGFPPWTPSTRSKQDQSKLSSLGKLNLGAPGEEMRRLGKLEVFICSGETGSTAV